MNIKKFQFVGNTNIIYIICGLHPEAIFFLNYNRIHQYHLTAKTLI